MGVHIRTAAVAQSVRLALACIIGQVTVGGRIALGHAAIEAIAVVRSIPKVFVEYAKGMSTERTCDLHILCGHSKGHGHIGLRAGGQGHILTATPADSTISAVGRSGQSNRIARFVIARTADTTTHVRGGAVIGNGGEDFDGVGGFGGFRSKCRDRQHTDYHNDCKQYA